MIYFLERIAEKLKDEYSDRLNKHCLVFPNRRAGLYFLKYLAAMIGKPVWAPSTTTINELFRSYSTLQIAGNEILLFELFKVYRKIKKEPESFDDFFTWGDMLLDDFDDVDKYLVNASLLFDNVDDLKKIDQQFGSLTEEQVEIVRRFWINFNPGKQTSEKAGFIGIWSILYDIYTSYRNSLKSQNLAYEGMIFREVAEYSGIDFPVRNDFDMYHFIGFNALNECEKSIMTRFKKAGKARFYWDFDNSFIREGQMNSAGFFMRDNLRLFGNDMPSDWNYDTMISSGVNSATRRIIEASSDVAQVKLVPKLIEELPGINSDNAHHTAVILADENLLMPVLTSLPENIGDINITMGHPLKQTLVYTLVKHLMDLQRNASTIDGIVRFNYRDVLCILKHALLSELVSKPDAEIIAEISSTNLIWISSDRFLRSEHLFRIFKKPLTPSLLSVYFKDILSMIASSAENSEKSVEVNPVQRNIRNEFIYRVVLSVNRLEAIINSSEISFSPETYIRILDRLLRKQSVPFSGEPLSGVQIMGILETRTLDFKNLIILSANEGVLPSVSSGSSFIPFSLREAFGLPSINHQESIYAYHFYRLLQRAENVTFTYNSNSEGLRSGEMSRFLIQMKYEKTLKPLFFDLNFEIKTHTSLREILERRPEHTDRLNSQFITGGKRRILSPSAINTWLNCSMKFYYRYVNNLAEPEKVSQDIDPAMLGNILHEIMRIVYFDYKGHVLTGEKIDSISRNKQFLSGIINEAIDQKFKYGGESFISGNVLIVREVLMEYVLRILKADKKISPFTIISLENLYSFHLSLKKNESRFELLTGGLVDRIDKVSGITRIVDYKTGTVSEAISSISDLFSVERKKDTDGWLQTLLYCEAYLINNPESAVRPSIYKVKKLTGSNISDKLKLKSENKNETIIDDYNVVRDGFMSGLKKTIVDIFSDEEPFKMTNDIRGKCLYCVYKVLCMR